MAVTGLNFRSDNQGPLLVRVIAGNVAVDNEAPPGLTHPLPRQPLLRRRPPRPPKFRRIRTIKISSIPASSGLAVAV